MSDRPDHDVKEDGKCPGTGYPCTCVPRSIGHWCCWSIPQEEVDRAAAQAPGVSDTRKDSVK